MRETFRPAGASTILCCCLELVKASAPKGADNKGFYHFEALHTTVNRGLKL